MHRSWKHLIAGRLPENDCLRFVNVDRQAPCVCGCMRLVQLRLDSPCGGCHQSRLHTTTEGPKFCTEHSAKSSISWCTMNTCSRSPAYIPKSGGLRPHPFLQTSQLTPMTHSKDEDIVSFVFAATGTGPYSALSQILSRNTPPSQFLPN